MSRYGMTLSDGAIHVVSLDDGKDGPWCQNPDCYLHLETEEEHHVENCPVYGTMHQAVHRLDEALAPVMAAFKAELRKTWQGRLRLRSIELRAAIAWRIRRTRNRLGRWRRRFL